MPLLHHANWGESADVVGVGARQTDHHAFLPFLRIEETKDCIFRTEFTPSLSKLTATFDVVTSNLIT